MASLAREKDKKEAKGSVGSATSAQSAPSQTLADHRRYLDVGDRAGCAGCVPAGGACRTAGALSPSKTVRLRLTVDAQGKVQKVVVLAGDRGLEACLARLFIGLASATVAQGAPTGTVEVTLTR